MVSKLDAKKVQLGKLDAQVKVILKRLTLNSASSETKLCKVCIKIILKQKHTVLIIAKNTSINKII